MTDPSIEIKEESIIEEETLEFEKNDNNLLIKLSDWSAYFQIEKTALNSLLRILKNEFSYFPEDLDDIEILKVEVHTSDDDFSNQQTTTSDDDKKVVLLKKPKKKSINKPKQCPICGVFRNNIEQHMRIHSGERPFKCTFCDMRFKDEGTRERHKRIHTGERPFACNYCEKKFKSSSNKIEHMRIHTGEKPFQCKICEKRFTTQALHNSHMFTHLEKHENIEALKRFFCPYCGRNFQTITAMNLHIRILHMGEKVFKCNSCEKSFTTRASQKYHETSAHGELANRRDLHTCTQCLKGFSSSTGLRNHMKLAHTVEKAKYNCPTCQKAFDLGSYLQKHIKRQKCKG